MNFKKNGGFTLVELIVVIAILGLLAGIGIPMYSGYVEKANEAVDNQNLNMLHNVFVVSCVSNGVDAGKVTITDVNFDPSTGIFSGISSVSVDTASMAFYGKRGGDNDDAPSAGDVGSAIVQSFTDYMGEPVQFKKIKDEGTIIAGVQNGVETEGSDESVRPTLPAGGQQTVQYQGKDIVVDNEDINNLKYSTFIDKIGTEDLMNQVNDITGIAADMADSNIMSAILDSDGFKQAAMTALNVTEDKLEEELFGLTYQYMQKHGCSMAEAEAQVKANAAVLYAAQQTGNMQVNDVKNLLLKTENNDPYTVISGNLTSTDGSGTGLSQAALAYGMYTAFVNSGATGSDKITDTSPDAVLDDLDNPDFQAYLSSTQGEADMAAYLSAMNVINSNTQQTDVVKDLMLNGYANTDLIGAINDAMGKVQ